MPKKSLTKINKKNDNNNKSLPGRRKKESDIPENEPKNKKNPKIPERELRSKNTQVLEKKVNDKKKGKQANDLKDEKSKNLLGKKRNISFTNDRTIKEYNPKSPVKDVKRVTRNASMKKKK